MKRERTPPAGSGRFLALLLFLLPELILAQEGETRLSLGTPGTLWAGQQITLNLELLTDGMSFAEGAFRLPEIEGAYLLQTDSTSIKLTERRGETPWQVLRYPLALYPQTGGAIRIPPLAVRFKSTREFGAEPVSFELETNALEVTVNWPPGAPEGSLVVTTTDYQMEQHWTLPEPPAETGDALKLTVTRSARNISAMLLPPLPVYQTEGLAAYADTPGVVDRSNRGQLVGERVDSITWVIEQPGNFRIPPIRFRSWDPAGERLRDHLVEGAEIAAVANPHSVPETSPTDNPASGAAKVLGAWLLAIVLMAAASGLVRRRKTRIIEFWHRILPPAKALLPDLNPGPKSR